jgi:hypothetical protein
MSPADMQAIAIPAMMLLLGLVSVDARAERWSVRPKHASPDQVELWLHFAQPGSRVELSLEPPDDAEAPEAPAPAGPPVLAVCATDCGVRVNPGNYRVRLVRPSGASGEQTLEVSHSQVVAVVPPDLTASSCGLAVAITGHIMTFVGGMLMFPGLMGGEGGTADFGSGRRRSTRRPPRCPLERRPRSAASVCTRPGHSD